MIPAAFNFVSTQPRGMCLAFLLLVYFAAAGLPCAAEALGPRAGECRARGASPCHLARDPEPKNAQPTFSRVCGSSGVTVVHSVAGGARGGAAGFAPRDLPRWPDLRRGASSNGVAREIRADAGLTAQASRGNLLTQPNNPATDRGAADTALDPVLSVPAMVVDRRDREVRA